MSSSDSKWLREKTHTHDCWNIIRENDYQIGNLQPHKYYMKNNAHTNTFTHSVIYLFKISYTDFMINYISFNYVNHCIAKNICCHDSHVSRGNSRNRSKKILRSTWTSLFLSFSSFLSFTQTSWRLDSSVKISLFFIISYTVL